MDELSKVSFPIDRSLVGVAGGRTTVSVAVGPLSRTLEGRPVVELIAFAALFVFARLLQQDTVQARVVVDAADRADSPVTARFAADATLAAALATTRVGIAEGAEIDLTILEQTGELAYRWHRAELRVGRRGLAAVVGFRHGKSCPTIGQ